MSAKLSPVKRALRDKFAWPGGYAFFLVMSDGGTLCTTCGREEFRSIAYSTRNNLRDGWKVEGVCNMSETDEAETCDHCGRVIE